MSVLLLALIVFVSASHVIDLNESNFDSVVAKYGFLLIEFYAPWCGHCKALAPEYEKAAEVLSGLETPLHLAKVDCDENKGLSERFEIKGFPTLKLWANGEIIEYNAGRKAEDIIAWYMKKTGPSSKQVNTLAQVAELADKNKSLIVYLGNDKSLNDIFTRVSNKYETITFAQCSSEECLAQNTVTIFKKYDEGKVNLEVPFTEESLNVFIQNNLYPLVSEANDDILTFVFENNKNIFFYFKNEGEDPIVEVIRSLAPAYKGTIYFIIATRGEELTQHLAEYYSITEDNFPAIRITDVISEDNVTHYNHSGEFTTEAIKKTIQDFFDGILKPYIKSEPIPLLQEAVYKIVADSYQDEVINSDKNVLLEYYAPWCGHCKKLAPEYEKIAYAYSHVDNLRIAKIDAAANDLEVNIEGYPSVKLYLAGDKANPIDYEGERDFNGIRLFLNEKLGLNVEESFETQSSEAKVDRDEL
jgi:protein disulfide-isomerase A1